MKINSVNGVQILDSRGNPTVRAVVILEDGSIHKASVPSGASTGVHEAVELRDEDKTKYFGKSVETAVNNINSIIQPAIIEKDIDPKTIDQMLLELDGTANKSNLGANAILAVSQAIVRANAYYENVPLWQFINEYYFDGIRPRFPRLFANVINGGKHADWNFDIQEFIVCPSEIRPSDSVRIASEIFHQLGKMLKKRGLSQLVGDEGGYSPKLNSNEEAFEAIIEAAKEIGYRNGKDYRIAIDAAASEFFEDGRYILKKDNQTISGEKLQIFYDQIIDKYDVFSLEDPFAEDDWQEFQKITKRHSNNRLIVGDDLLVTNPKRIKTGIDKQAANAILVKINQIGSIVETVEAIHMARQANWSIIISHRSGETEDDFIADLAFGCAADFIKTGSMSRSDRLAKYNRLLEIEALEL